MNLVRRHASSARKARMAHRISTSFGVISIGA
jgi:hypothetical protein